MRVFKVFTAFRMSKKLWDRTEPLRKKHKLSKTIRVLLREYLDKEGY